MTEGSQDGFESRDSFHICASTSVRKDIQWYRSVHALNLLGDECRNIMVTFLQFWKQYLDCNMKEYLLDVDTMQNNPWCVEYRIDDSYPAHLLSQCYVNPPTIRDQTNTTEALLGALSMNSSCEDTCHIDDSNDPFLSLSMRFDHRCWAIPANAWSDIVDDPTTLGLSDIVLRMTFSFHSNPVKHPHSLALLSTRELKEWSIPSSCSAMCYLVGSGREIQTNIQGSRHERFLLSITDSLCSIRDVVSLPLIYIGNRPS